MPNKGYKHTSAARQKISRSLCGRIVSQKTRTKIGNKNRGKHHTKEIRAYLSKINLGEKNPKYGNPISDDTRERLSKSKRGEKNPMFGKHPSDKTREILSKQRHGKPKSYNHRMKVIESLIGGFWYGNVRSNEHQYCELWTPELRERIRAYWNYKSVLSGKTKEDNGGRILSCHHVYYQKKACCVWDEDILGYYTWINGEKYYIDGDPNKFVVLTAGENAMVNYNKIKWVKYFEKFIKSQGGQCYLPMGMT